MRLNVTTDQLAYLLDGEVRGQTRQITGISFDSRTTSPGDVLSHSQVSWSMAMILSRKRLNVAPLQLWSSTG